MACASVLCPVIVVNRALHAAGYGDAYGGAGGYAAGQKRDYAATQGGYQQVCGEIADMLLGGACWHQADGFGYYSCPRNLMSNRCALQASSGYGAYGAPAGEALLAASLPAGSIAPCCRLACVCRQSDMFPSNWKAGQQTERLATTERQTETVLPRRLQALSL